MNARRLAALGTLLLAAWSAAGARTLHQASNSATSTSETNTYLEAASILGSATAATAEDCSKSCLNSSSCFVWAWCPATEASGCPVYYGSIGPVDPAPATPVSIKAGACQLSTDVSDGMFSIFASRGEKMPFTSGIVRRPAPEPVPPPDPKANDTQPTQTSMVSFLPVVDNDCLLACKKAGLVAFDFGDPAQQICAVAVNGRDWWGTHASGSKTCEYSTKDDGGSKQGKAETAAGATEAAYQCACIKEADKPKAEWKEMLTCPAGYSPLDSDINMCRVIVDGERASIGWIQTDTCYFRLAKHYWGALTYDLVQVTGIGDDVAKLSVLCLKN